MNVEPPLILTLDVGTSSVRAMLFDRRGREVEGSQASLTQEVRTTPDGGAELEADELVEGIARCVEGTLGRAGDWRKEIAGVALTTFWHSFLGVDEAGQAQTPIYLWADTRSRAEVAELRRRLDERAVHARTGCLFHTSYFPARLLWLHRTDPARFRQVHRWLSPGEYLLQKLFGEPRCSVSMASGTGLFDQHRQTWDGELLAALSLRPEHLAPVVDLDEPARDMRGEVDPRFRPLAEVPWFPPVGDGACSNVGCGCVSPERLALMVGTSGAMRVLGEGPALLPPWGLWLYRADRHRFLIGGALSNGGNLLAWLLKTLQVGDPEDLERQLAAMEPDAHGLTVLPFLAGERSPHWPSHARAAIVGLQWGTEPIDIVRAGLEAVAYRFALIHERLQQAVPGMRQIIATGGALLRSPAWMQIMADVLGQPVIASQEGEASSRGAALLALEALGLLTHLRDAPVALGRTYEPNPEHYDRYREGLARQQEVYDQLIGPAKTSSGCMRAAAP